MAFILTRDRTIRIGFIQRRKSSPLGFLQRSPPHSPRLSGLCGGAAILRGLLVGLFIVRQDRGVGFFRRNLARQEVAFIVVT